MNRGLIFETTLEQIEGGLFLQLAVALREHYISPESFVWSPRADGAAVTVWMTVRPHDARWLPDVAEHLHRLSGIRDMKVCDDGEGPLPRAKVARSRNQGLALVKSAIAAGLDANGDGDP